MLLLFPVFFGPYSFLHTVLHASCSKSELMRKILQKLWHHHHWCCLTPCPSLPEMFFTVPTDLLTITSTSILMGRYIPCWRCPGVEFWRCSFQISSVLRLLPFQFFLGIGFYAWVVGFFRFCFLLYSLPYDMETLTKKSFCFHLEGFWMCLPVPWRCFRAVLFFIAVFNNFWLCPYYLHLINLSNFWRGSSFSFPYCFLTFEASWITLYLKHLGIYIDHVAAQ